ncbi:MAG: hypothetical protein KAU14_07480 [Thermoplasmata archaeon]|nr:hypothetical protein [Thermoplasmata archaeon]
MTWIMVHILKPEIGIRFNEFCKRNPDLLISKINRNIYIFKNDGEALAFLTKRKIMDKEWIDLYAIEPLELFSMPEKVKRVGEFLAAHPQTTAKKAINHIPEINDMKELKKCQIRFERTRD